MTHENTDLDNYSSKILFVLIQEKNEIGFNKLLKEVKKQIKITKPTLITHLKLLEEKQYIIKRKNSESNLNMKPTYYSLNFEKIGHYIKGIIPEAQEHPLYSLLHEFNKKIQTIDFQVLAWSIMRFIYFSDLTMTKLTIERLSKKNSDNEELKFSQIVLSKMLDIMMSRIFELSKTMKDEDFQTVLAEFDNQIDKVHEFFKTGELPP